MGLFAPAATVGLLLAWLLALILGYGLVFYAIRDQIQPVPGDLGDALYFAATSLLTLGFGDFVASGAAARIFSTIAAITGLGAVALVVTFLFSLFGSYQRRERRVVTLQAAAGAPPSAVALLETYALLGLVDSYPICSVSGKTGRSKSSTRTSPIPCSPSSGRATTTCPGSARSGRSWTPRAWC